MFISRLRFLDNHAFFFYVGCVLRSVIPGYIVSIHNRQKTKGGDYNDL
jgi:hypothetical protein